MSKLEKITGLCKSAVLRTRRSLCKSSLVVLSHELNPRRHLAGAQDYINRSLTDNWIRLALSQLHKWQFVSHVNDKLLTSLVSFSSSPSAWSVTLRWQDPLDPETQVARLSESGASATPSFHPVHDFPLEKTPWIKQFGFLDFLGMSLERLRLQWFRWKQRNEIVRLRDRHFGYPFSFIVLGWCSEGLAWKANGKWHK